MRVRPYAAADLDDLIGLFRQSVREVACRDYSPEQVLAWAPDEIDRGTWALRLGASRAWVAARGDRTAGFATLEPDGHLDMLYVHAAFQRCGVASKLVDRLECAARSCGLTGLFTEASITAKPFFERRGFHVVEKQLVALRGQEFANFRMVRPLV